MMFLKWSANRYLIDIKIFTNEAGYIDGEMENCHGKNNSNLGDARQVGLNWNDQ